VTREEFTGFPMENDKSREFTTVPNEFFELLPELTDAETRVLLCVIRQTYGWHKMSDYLSISQLMEKTGLSRQGVVKAIKSLEVDRLIEVRREGRINRINVRYRA